MSRTVKLSRVASTLGELPYPISRKRAREELDDVTVLLADGEESLGAVVAESNVDSFASSEELQAEVYNHLPTAAVGEPGQSEGEG